MGQFPKIDKTGRRRKSRPVSDCRDLFHRQPLMKELKEVNYLFSTIPDTKVVLIAGNHDYLKRESCYRRFSWAENVFCLWGEQEPCVEFPNLGAAVYGISYDRKESLPPYITISGPRDASPWKSCWHMGGTGHIYPLTDPYWNGPDFLTLPWGIYTNRRFWQRIK